MKVTILGTRGNIKASARGYSRHSGILIDGTILLDVGEKTYFSHHPKFVFITHFHPDHAAFNTEDVPKGVVLYGPELCPSLPMVRTVSEPVRAAGYMVTAVPTVHSRNVRSVGYLIEKGQERVFYSSDLIGIKPRFHRLLLNLDLVITEGSFIRSGGLVRMDRRTGAPMGHNGIPELVRFFNRFTSRIIITHFGTWFFDNIEASRHRIESLGNGVQVVAARDGMQIVIPSRIRADRQ